MPGKLLVITTYPPKENPYDKNVGGAAHYINQILETLPKDLEIEVLCSTYVKEAYRKEPNITVTPTWDKGEPRYLTQIIKAVSQRKNFRKVLINFEFKLFGGKGVIKSSLNLLLLIPLFIYLRLQKKKILFVMHPAILKYSDMINLSSHLNINEKPWLTAIYTFGNLLISKIFFTLSSQIITFEKHFGEKIQETLKIRKEKINIIPHPLHQHAPRTAKIDLPGLKKSDFKLLFFGYLVPYKGIDWLVELANSKAWPKDIKLIIGGGESPTADSKEYYQALLKQIKNQPNIIHTGYVEDDQLNELFKIADLIILPYNVLIASSGPMGHTIGHEKPLIMSEVLKPYTDTPDFAVAMREIGIIHKEFVFPLQKEKLLELLESYRDNPAKLERLTKLSKKLKQSRSLEETGKKYMEVIEKLC